MEPQERHYNIEKLNRLFAIAALVLLVALASLVANDYNRDWKNYQRDFQQLEMETTRVKYDLELNKLKNKPEYQQLQNDLAAAQKDYQDKCANLTDVNKAIAKSQAENDILNQKYRVVKAEFDAAKFSYEDGRENRAADLNARQKKYETLQKNVSGLKLDIERSEQAIRASKTKLDSCGQQLTDLKRQERTLASQVSILQRKLKKIDPIEMNFTNQIAQIVRNFPILDLANPNDRIEQIVLKDITDDVNFMRVPKVDRCITCHQGIDNPDYKDAPQPFRTHPNLELYISQNSSHPMEDFGCTVCHNGRGRGTDFNSAAHTPASEEQAREWEEKYQWRELHHWETPMYPSKYTEASCFKCHSGQTVIKGAEKLSLGMNLLERAGCYSCHAIEKYKNWPKPGPDLTHLAAKTSKEWSYRWIEDPKTFRHNTWMPAFFGQSNTSDPESLARSQQEIHAIVQYLYKNSSEFSLSDMPQWGNAQKGEEIVSAVGCLACHNIEQTKSGALRTRESLLREQGPNLIGLGAKTNKIWLYNWLKDPHRYHPATKMPNLRLTDKEAADVAAFLVQDKTPTPQTPLPPVNEQIINTIAKEFLQKNLSQAESNEKISKMSLDDKLSFTGEKLIGQYGCFACHAIKGFENSKPIGTDLTEEGSKNLHNLDFGFVHIPHSKEAWFKQKLLNPRIFDQDKIKAPDEKLRMPNYHFTDAESEAITTALLGFVKDKPGKIKPRTARNQSIEEGAKLVRQFNCQSCHKIEGEGGAVQAQVAEWLVKYDNRSEEEAKALINSFSPPNLIGEGKKVQTQWLFEFLHEPAEIRPWLKVRMPTYKMNAAHLNALVKYFSALDNEEFPFTDKLDVTLTPDEYRAAEKLFSKDYFGCAQCHIVGAKLPSGSADSWAPNFALAKTRLKPNWVSEWIRNPQPLLPGTKMPNFYDPHNFNTSGPEDIANGDENEQIRILRNYIMTLTGHEHEGENTKAEPKAEAPAPEAAPPAAPEPEATPEQTTPVTTNAVVPSP